eukprot:6491155-Amphidinium_carterae.1
MHCKMIQKKINSLFKDGRRTHRHARTEVQSPNDSPSPLRVSGAASSRGCRSSCPELDGDGLESLDGASAFCGSFDGEGDRIDDLDSSLSADDEMQADGRREDEEDDEKEGEADELADDKEASTKGKKPQKEGKKPATKGSIPCRGCPKMFLQHEMYPGGNMCRPCKKAYDCLHRLARRDGGKVQTWWESTRDNAKELKRCIRKFKTSCPDLGIGRGKSRVKSFSLIEYIEAVKFRKSNERRNRGEYLTEIQFKELRFRYLDVLQLIRAGEKKKLREQLLEIKDEQVLGLKGKASRAAPIQQFEELVSTSCLSSKGSFFESCTDGEAIKAVWTTHVNPGIARWREVIGACKKMCADIAA